MTIHNKYLPENPRSFSLLVRNTLLAAIRKVGEVRGHNLPPEEMEQAVADLFNDWHLRQVQDDCYGYGGKIRTKTVAEFFKLEGNKIFQGDLGIRPVPQLTKLPPVNNMAVAGPPIQQPVPQPPIQPCNYAKAPYRTPTVRTSEEIDSMSQKQLKAACRQVGLPTWGANNDFRERLKKYFRL